MPFNNNANYTRFEEVMGKNCKSTTFNNKATKRWENSALFQVLVFDNTFTRKPSKSTLNLTSKFTHQ